MAKAKSQVAQLPQTYQTMLERAINTLKMMKDKADIDFVVYSETYNIKVGTIKLEKLGKRKRIHSKLPRGTMTAFLSPLMDGLAYDELVTIPVGTFDLSSLQSSVSSRASILWGAGTYTALRTKDKKAIELWRLPQGMDKSTLVDPHPMQKEMPTQEERIPREAISAVNRWSLDN
jgi:hypothetical protein